MVLIGLPKVSLSFRHLPLSSLVCFLPSKTVLLVSVQEPIHIERPLEDVVFKSLTLKTVHGRKIFHTWRESERIMHQNL